MKSKLLHWLPSVFLRYYLLFLFIIFAVIAGADRMFWHLYEPQPLFSLQDVVELSVEGQRPTQLNMEQLGLSAKLKQQLVEQGWLRVTDGNQGYYFYVYQDDEHLTEIGPLPKREHQEWLAPALFYSALALVLFVLLYPLFRDLQNLRNSVDRFARQRDPRVFDFTHGFYLKNVVVTLRTMSVRLTEMMQLTREVSDTLSHELRTPLARLRFSLATLTAKQDQEIHQAMQADIAELDALIDEYLQYTRAENTEPDLFLSWLSLAELLEPVLVKFRQFSQCEIAAEFATDMEVKVEPRLFIRVINNLLGNACKYANQRVLVRVSDLGDAGWRLEVEDDGPGFGDDPSHLLLPFAQSAISQHGYGLGLAIVEKAMSWHQGRVELGKATTLGGACVSVSWPKLAD